jgi:antagonist of KipI
MSLRVLDPGLYTLPVDFGRPNSRSLGVPVGGAADRFALAIGNALVGNPPDSAALEMSLAGPTLEAGCELACVVYGAPFVLDRDRHRLAAGVTFTLRSREVLRIGTTPAGMRAYLCVRGGFQTQLMLGSRSGLEPVRAGTELPCQAGSIPARFIQPVWAWNREPRTLRVVEGPQAEWFQTGPFYLQDYEITPASNRMGLRLRGEALRLAAARSQSGANLESEPVCPGTVQVTSDGQGIILGVDGQTMGGYPKVALVISADQDKLGQLRPGERVRFARVSIDEAKTLYRQKQAELREWLARFQSAEVFA